MTNRAVDGLSPRGGRPLGAYPRDPAGWAARREENFARMLDLIYAAHPYYRGILAALGLGREAFHALVDITLIPPIDKAVVAAQPEAFTLEEGALADRGLEERAVWQIIYTTGTTGRPTPFVDRAHDHYSRLWQMRLAAEIAGITERDLVLNLMPLTAVPHQGFLSATYGPLALGAPLLAGVGGRPNAQFPVQRELDDIVRLAERHRVTVLWGIATFTRRFIVRAQELGADLSSVRLVLAMGEACPGGMREDMRVRLAGLGARQVRILNGYGFTEMQGPTMECDEEAGFHVPNPAEYHFEILDSKELRPLPEGAMGIVTVSHLNRRGTVLLRYMTGDISALTSEPCPRCGRGGPRFTRTPYRLSGLTKIKGVLVNPANLHEALAAVSRLGAYQIVVSKEHGDPYGLDELTVRILCDPDDFVAVSANIIHRIRSACEVTPRIESISADIGAQWAQGYKHDRFIDTRKAAGS